MITIFSLFCVSNANAFLLQRENSINHHLLFKKPYTKDQNLLFSTATTEDSLITPPQKTNDEPVMSVIDDMIPPDTSNDNDDERKYWNFGTTQFHMRPRPLNSELFNALLTNSHPKKKNSFEEAQSDLGRGIYLMRDWRRAWYTYGSLPTSARNFINPDTGHAEYEIDEIEGKVPDDLVGVLYRNGGGKFGVGEERVVHVLDADGLIVRIEIPKGRSEDGRRKIMFRSKFIETRGFQDENKSNKFLHRNTFGTGRRGLPQLFGNGPKRGLNSNPASIPLLSRIAGNAMDPMIKNVANTSVIQVGRTKLFAFWEAGLPHLLDPKTLETIGEYDMFMATKSSSTSDGEKKKKQSLIRSKDDQPKLPIRINQIPTQFQPTFANGSAHTAHPKYDPNTRRLVGWNWVSLPTTNSMEITFTEWSCDDDGLQPCISKTFIMKDFDLAPHDMVVTQNYIVFIENALNLDKRPFLAGIAGPAECLSMDGRANVRAHVFPRPSSSSQEEPFVIDDVPPCFALHFSHGYEDAITNHIVCYMSGWPPSDAKDFLGAWGGFMPDYKDIPATFLWRIEIDPKTKKCIDLRIAPGASNICLEFPSVHPNFKICSADNNNVPKNVYVASSNAIGDSSAPSGYAKIQVEESSSKLFKKGELNSQVDAYWFGTRRFTDECIVVPKHGGDENDENDAYLLGMVMDAVEDKSFLAVFDLKRDLSEGPVCKFWLKSALPHMTHGCFVVEDDGGDDGSVWSVFN